MFMPLLSSRQFRVPFCTTMTAALWPRLCRMVRASARSGSAPMLSHYVIGDRYGRPGKGNDKGKVEGLVGYGRRNFMVPPLMHVNMHCRAVDAPLC